MQLRLTVREPGNTGTDVLVDADPANSVAALAERIGVAIGRPAKDLFVDGIWLDPDLPLHLAPIRDGVELGLDAAMPDATARGICEVRVVGGPGAGTWWRLGPGEVTVGSAESDRIHVTGIGTAALTIRVGTDGAATVTPAAGTTARLETALVNGTTPWPRRHLLAIGSVLLEVATPEFPDAALRPSADGATLDYARPPRLAPAPRVSQFALPSPPKENQRRPMPWVMAIVPLVGALVMAKLFGNLAFLAFAILSPVMVMANHLTERRQGKRTHRETVAEYLARRARIEADAEDALTAEQAERRSAHPDPAALGLTATGPGHRLWERRRTDPDRLSLRVGTGTLPSEVVLTDPEREEHERRDPLALHEVPVTVNLAEHGVVGVAGRTEHVRALGRWLVAQSAALHSPSDLSICVLTDPAGASDWSWVAWLPHARPQQDEGAVALVGTGVETVGRRIAELQAQLTARQVMLRQAGTGARLDAADVLVVLDGSRRLRALPGVAALLQDGPAVGIHLICLDTEERLLPEECRAVVTLDDRGAARVSQTGATTVDGVRPDLVSPEWGESVARALAPLRDVSRDEDGALPESCRLLDVLGQEPPTGERIAAGWLVGGRTTRAVLGLSVDGEFAVDLAKDGPHGLVAGTTGSGKSELLQTLIASLAVANRPDEMTFVLVDYKGGAAFAECAALPHTVGMVTDLDAQLVTRALASLGAELRRREHVFAAAHAADLDRYQDARRRNPALAPMPRLVLVIDEFASLARELPDFVSGLVNVAQRGRSLGIHLILATQRPSGVVSNDIRANTNLRIALRVTDTAESQDVIDAPDAARISKNTPGRAYVRLGHGSLLPFQAARIGGRRLAAQAENDTLPDPFVVTLGADALGLPAPARPDHGSPEITPVTDLAVLVAAVRAAAEQLNVPAQPSPWLAPLPDLVLLDDLAADARGADTLRPAPFAFVDVPAEQAQRVEAVDLETFGHLLVAGAARSGRSTVLRTIGASLARHNSSADVHLFGLDCGNGALLRLGELPHCGAVVRSSEVERAERLLDRLSSELRTRSTLLGERHVADITEQRANAAPGERLPHLVLLLDRWEGFLPTLGERDGGRLTDQVIQLIREGAGVGIHVVLAGDHTVLGGRIGSLTDHKIALRLSDPGDYSLIGINPRTVPDSLPDGRAYRSGSGDQLQVALLDPDLSGTAQGRAVARIAAAALERDADVPRAQLPFGVDVLPARIGFADAWTLQTGEPGPLWGLVGVGGDRLTALGPDLAAGVPAFVIAGPSRSGRSTALCALAESYLATGVSLLLVTPRPSPLSAYGDRPGARAVAGDLDPVTLDEALAVDRLVILVDDAELLRDSAAGTALTSILRRERSATVGIVLAGDADSVCAGFGGWQVEAKKARRGLLLSPQNLTDADLVGARIPRSLVGRPVEPGRGLLHLGDGNLTAVQVPLP